MKNAYVVYTETISNKNQIEEEKTRKEQERIAILNNNSEFFCETVIAPMIEEYSKEGRSSCRLYFKWDYWTKAYLHISDKIYWLKNTQRGYHELPVKTKGYIDINKIISILNEFDYQTKLATETIWLASSRTGKNGNNENIYCLDISWEKDLSNKTVIIIEH